MTCQARVARKNTEKLVSWQVQHVGIYVGVTSRACTKRFTASSAQSSRKVAGLGPVSVEASVTSWDIHDANMMPCHGRFCITKKRKKLPIFSLWLSSFAESLLNSTLICPPWLGLCCQWLSQISAKLDASLIRSFMITQLMLEFWMKLNGNAKQP